MHETDRYSSVAAARAVRRCRTIAAAAGLVLASTFVMPAVSGCKQPIIPATTLAGVLFDEPASLEALFWVLISTPYVLGTLIATITLRSLGKWTAAGELRMGRCLTYYAALSAAGVHIWLLVSVFFDDHRPDIVFWLLLSLFSAVYLMRCLFKGAPGRLCARWYAAVCCVIWFASWVTSPIYYGLWLSLGAAILLSGAAFAEARIRSRASNGQTLIQLLTIHIRLRDLEERLCMLCGYELTGLVSGRCPECGTAAPGPPVLHRSPNGVYSAQPCVEEN